MILNYGVLTNTTKNNSPAMIFKEAWLHVLVSQDIAKDCLRRWKKTFNKKWELWFTKEARWRKIWAKDYKNIDISSMNKEEYIKYLETKNAYLEELNKHFKEDLP